MIDVEPLIVSELERMLPLPDGRRADWGEVLQRARIPGRRLRWRPVLVAAVVVAALAGVGVAIAAALGAFDGISAANHPQTSADVLSPQTVARLTQNCTDAGASSSFYMPNCHLVFGSSRLVGQLPDGRDVYVVADTRGDLCVLLPALMMGCGTSLSPSKPLTAASFGDALDKPTIVYGVALDGVNAVSFEMAGHEVTVPVKDNVWVYEGPPGATLPEALTAHFADGTMVTLRS
jgi:hypothetical protein